MKIRCLIASLALLVCAGAANAESVVVGRTPAKTSAAITLHNTSPTSIMWDLKLLNMQDVKTGNTSVWRKDGLAAPVLDPSGPGKPAITASAVSTAPKTVLPGIDLVVACDSEQALIVYGDKSAVQKLKTAVAAMDVVHRQVQMKAEAFTLECQAAKKIDFDKYASVGGEARQAEFRQMMTELGARLLGTPIITTIENAPCEVNVASGTSTLKLLAIPRVNGDGSITVAADLSFTEIDIASRSQALYTQRRFSSGEAAVMGGFISQPSSGSQQELLMLLSARVVDK